MLGFDEAANAAYFGDLPWEFLIEEVLSREKNVDQLNTTEEVVLHAALSWLSYNPALFASSVSKPTGTDGPAGSATRHSSTLGECVTVRALRKDVTGACTLTGTDFAELGGVPAYLYNYQYM